MEPQIKPREPGARFSIRLTDGGLYMEAESTGPVDVQAFVKAVRNAAKLIPSIINTGDSDE